MYNLLKNYSALAGLYQQSGLGPTAYPSFLIQVPAIGLLSETSSENGVILVGESTFPQTHFTPDTGQFVSMRSGATNEEFFKNELLELINTGVEHVRTQLGNGDVYSEALKLTSDGKFDHFKPGTEMLSSLFAHVCETPNNLLNALPAISGKHPEWNISVNDDRPNQSLTYTVQRNKWTSH